MEKLIEKKLLIYIQKNKYRYQIKEVLIHLVAGDGFEPPTFRL